MRRAIRVVKRRNVIEFILKCTKWMFIHSKWCIRERRFFICACCANNQPANVALLANTITVTVTPNTWAPVNRMESVFSKSIHCIQSGLFNASCHDTKNEMEYEWNASILFSTPKTKRYKKCTHIEKHLPTWSHNPLATSHAQQWHIVGLSRPQDRTRKFCTITLILYFKQHGKQVTFIYC